ncbi:MAG TPA: Asp23/Gls24 family envelope stress response protein [Clostridiales bacterium]|nr:Asp23/Gls24 family envelope stress response protein [Clostridiales bacterium]
MAENYISCQDDRGSINISEDVIISMVRAAINEVEGVAALTQPAASELAELLGIKSASKGLKVQFVDGQIAIDAVIMVRYGFNVVNVAQQVQDAVTAAIESMTGMGKPQVNIHVSGVAFDK